MRAPGFYWVGYNGRTTVGEWSGGSCWWYVVADEVPIPDDDIEVLSERLTPPE